MKLNLEYCNMENIYIYALIGRDENDVRYIGQSKNPYVRLSQHRCLGSSESKLKKDWIRALKNDGIQINMIILEKCRKEEGDFLERYYISLYKSWGFDLINQQSGGIKTYNHSQKRREELSEHFKNYKEEFGFAMKGKCHSEKTKLKISQSKISSSILQFDLNGTLIKKWDCGYKTIGRILNIDSTGIYDCLKGTLRKSYNSLWLFEKDFSEEKVYQLFQQLTKRRKEKHTGILQFDLDGNFLKEWTFSELKKTFKNTSRIVYCLNEHCKHAYNFIWIYKEKYNNYGTK